MLARVISDIITNKDDELSLRKGTELKVLDIDETNDWYKAEVSGKEGYVPRSSVQLCPTKWFTDKKTRAEAEEILLSNCPNGCPIVQPDGAFLVRKCETHPREFSLSVKSRNQVHHYRILRDINGYYFVAGVKFDSINALIDYYRTHSIDPRRLLSLQDMIPVPKSSRSYSCDTPPKHQDYIVVSDFQPEYEGEIELRKNDVVQVIESEKDGWSTGQSRGKYGIFPTSYIRPLNK